MASRVRTAGSVSAHAELWERARSYFGGAWERSALATVLRESPNLRAIAVCVIASELCS